MQLVVQRLSGLDHSSLDVGLGQCRLRVPVIRSVGQDGLACGDLLMGLALGVVDILQQHVYLVILIRESCRVDTVRNKDRTGLIQIVGLDVRTGEYDRRPLVIGVRSEQILAKRLGGFRVTFPVVHVALRDLYLHVGRFYGRRKFYERPGLAYHVEMYEDYRLAHQRIDVIGVCIDHPVQRNDGPCVIAFLLLDRCLGYPILGIVQIHKYGLIVGDLGQVVLSRHLLRHTLGMPVGWFRAVHLHRSGERFDGIVVLAGLIFRVALDRPHVHVVAVDVIVIVGQIDDIVELPGPRQGSDDIHEQNRVLFHIQRFPVGLDRILLPAHLGQQDRLVLHRLRIIRVKGDDPLALHARTLVVGGLPAQEDVLLEDQGIPVPLILLQYLVDILQRLIRGIHRHVDT